MNAALSTMVALRLLALLPAGLAVLQGGRPAWASDDASARRAHRQSIQQLFDGEFAILRMQGNRFKVVGVGFVIHQAPMRILTCYHVVSEANEMNDGPVVYSIARRIEATNEIGERIPNAKWRS